MCRRLLRKIKNQRSKIKIQQFAIFAFCTLIFDLPLQAEVFIDDFNTPHDYVANGVAGTIWDDFIGWAPGETVTALNASIDRPGQLFISSRGAYWSEPWNPLGPFLFKVVKGDFIATVKVTDYAGTPTAVVFHNDCGLMARAYRDDAGPGEDWVTIDYFPIWNCGNFLWQAMDNVRNEAWGCNNGKRWNLDPYLQLERKGNIFHFRTSKDGVSWTEMPCSPKTRNDFDGLPLMVGLRHATYSTALGYAAFDDFRLEIIVKLKAYEPVPADKAGDVSTNVLQWTAGDTAAWHDLYLGTDPAALSRVDRYPASQTSYTHSVGFAPGVTYYWRVDEVEADSVTIHTGDVWSFTAIPLAAWNPSPADDELCVLTDADLSWRPGAKAQSHDVYFGTSQTAVANASTSSPEFKGNQPKNALTYALPSLAFDTLYYWRIDERNTDATVSKGDVWRFRTVPFISIADPNLVGWWKLDGVCGESDIVLDSSGYNHHGRWKGNPQWVAGYDGGALQFDGRDDYVELPIGSLISQLSNSTFATWANFANSGGAWQHMFDFGNDTNVYMFLTPRIYFIDPMRFAITTTGGTGEIQVTAPATLPSEWHHVAVTINANTRTITLYLDGEVVAQNTQARLSPKDLGVTANNWLGRSQYADDAYYMGSIDDFRIYNYALSQAQISKVMRGPTLAWNPRPPDGSTPDMEHATPLSWSPGDKAAKHDVYFGTDANTVGNADTSDTTGIYRGRQDPNAYSLPDALQWGKTYYWRIDEYNTDGTISKGRIWSFTIADYLIVDDFEDYDDFGNRIFQTWRDGLGFSQPAPGYPGNGTGSAVGNSVPPFAERTIVHSGVQSMPFAYDNSGAEGRARYSETFREWASPQDWTRKAVKALTLWFYGDPANSVAPLYVAVEDSLGKSAAVTNSDPDAVLFSPWQEWNISLAEFASAGVNLSGVKKIYIGVGNRTAPQAGGSGKMYFDDIRLYPARCVPSLLQPAADLNDDCVVDYSDLAILADRWLDTGLIVTPVDPGSANLVGHWKFDDGSGSTATDSSVNANKGTLVGDTQWVAGHDGGALRFDGTDDYVELPIGPLIGQLSNCTFAIWANFANAGGAWQRIFDFGTGETFYMFLCPRIGMAGAMRFAITTQGGGAPEQMVTAPSTLPSGWHHVAVTIDADKDTVTLYLDGSVVAQNTQVTLSPKDLGVTTNNWLGRSQYIADAGYMGLLDEFRIYNRVLSAGQICWLAGRTAPFSIPADIHQDGMINLADFAELADSWLEELLWP